MNECSPASWFCLAVCPQARELSSELKTAAGVSGRGAGGTPFAEPPSSGAPERPLTNAQTQGVSDAYFKLLRAFVPLITDEVQARALALLRAASLPLLRPLYPSCTLSPRRASIHIKAS